MKAIQLDWAEKMFREPPSLTDTPTSTTKKKSIRPMCHSTQSSRGRNRDSQPTTHFFQSMEFWDSIMGIPSQILIAWCAGKLSLEISQMELKSLSIIISVVLKLSGMLTVDWCYFFRMVWMAKVQNIAQPELKDTSSWVMMILQYSTRRIQSDSRGRSVIQTCRLSNALLQQTISMLLEDSLEEISVNHSLLSLLRDYLDYRLLSLD